MRENKSGFKPLSPHCYCQISFKVVKKKVKSIVAQLAQCVCVFN